MLIPDNQKELEHKYILIPLWLYYLLTQHKNNTKSNCLVKMLKHPYCIENKCGPLKEHGWLTMKDNLINGLHYNQPLLSKSPKFKG